MKQILSLTFVSWTINLLLSDLEAKQWLVFGCETTKKVQDCYAEVGNGKPSLFTLRFLDKVTISSRGSCLLLWNAQPPYSFTCLFLEWSEDRAFPTECFCHEALSVRLLCCCFPCCCLLCCWWYFGFMMLLWCVFIVFNVLSAYCKWLGNQWPINFSKQARAVRTLIGSLQSI